MIHFVNITEKEFFSSKRLYKHMPLEYALKTLEEKQLWFADPKTWSDPFEKRFLEAKYIKSGKETPFKWRDRVFCTCMSRTSSSEAFWRMYSSDQICIEFRFIRRQLYDVLNNLPDYEVYIGSAEYMKTKDIERPLKEIPFDPPCNVDMNSGAFAARLLMLKRVSFEYEDEIRIILVSKNAGKKNGIAVPYFCDSKELINQIVIDPRVGNYTSKLLKDCFKERYGFDLTPKGNPRVLQSVLYREQKQMEIALD